MDASVAIYTQLASHIESLSRKGQSEIIFAESVGSCTDLIATVIKPLHKFTQAESVVLSVFADAGLLASFFLKHRKFFIGKINYIYDKQLEEADILVVSKIDTLKDDQLEALQKAMASKFRHKIILYQNSRDPEHLQLWLSTLSNFIPESSRQSLSINDDYAAGEAEMAWFDGELKIESQRNNAGEIGIQLINHIFQNLKAHKAAIGHLKFLIHNREEKIKVSFTSLQEEKKYSALVSDSKEMMLLINARVETDPDSLEKIIMDSIHYESLHGHCILEMKHKHAFQPGYPTPTHRMA